MSYAGNPLPQTPPGNRPRAKSSFSFHSRKSSGSGGGLQETHEEKDKKRLHSKADPSVAMTEDEPSAVQSQQKVSMSPIRAIQHRDNQGNPIADPDRSNPTRSRWERPLDTIRSFEAAIDGAYNRKSMYRSDASDVASTYGGGYNRRSSYFAGSQMGMDDRPRFPQNGYYGGRSHKPDSQYQTRPDSYYNGNDNMSPTQQGYGYQNPRGPRYPRTASEPYNNAQGVYPVNGNQQSYETVTSGSGSSGERDPAGYQTDPSSENSSVDRITPLPMTKDPSESYGFNGFGGDPQYPPPVVGVNQQPYNPAQRQGDGYLNQATPPLPPKDVGPKVPIKLGNSTGAAPANETSRPSPGEKRKSWFGRRFSKS